MKKPWVQPVWKVTIGPFISPFTSVDTGFPEWVGMRLEGDKIRNLDKLVIPNVAPDAV